MRHLLENACLMFILGCSSNGGDDSCANNACPSEGGPTADAGTDVVMGDDGPAPPTGGGRLFVSINKPAADAGVSGSILVWEGIDTLTQAVPPSFALANATGSSAGLTLVGPTLVSSPQGGGFALFTNASTLTASSPATSWGLGYADWGSFTYTASLDALWATHPLQGTARYDQASILSSSSTAAMQFSYGGYSSSFVYDPTGDRAFVGRLSTTTINAWNGAKSLTGSTTTVAPSYTLSSTFAAGDMAIGHDRLYALGSASSGSPEVIGVWAGISTTTGTTPPAFTITAGNPMGTSGAIATPNDLLIVCQNAGVLIWKNASTLTADTAPDFSLTTQIVQARKVVFAPMTDRLYVLGDQAVTIWSSASTNPTFVAKLTTPTLAQDLVILE